MLDSIERPLELDLTPIPSMDGPPPKLDQHKPSHSRSLHVTNDDLLNMMECMT